jgi:hypothetical protein
MHITMNNDAINPVKRCEHPRGNKMKGKNALSALIVASATPNAKTV